MHENNKTTDKKGILINKAKKGKYSSHESIENVIRYIARENGEKKDDLICSGAFGATDFTDIDTMIRQFECVQLLHNRKGNFGRYIDHEIFSFPPKAEVLIGNNYTLIETLAREMAADFYRDGFQVYYGVHKKDQSSSCLHVHFAVNTVNYKTGKKRHENKIETSKRQKRLMQMVDDTIRQCSVN